MILSELISHTFGGSLISAVVFGIVGILLTVFGFKAFDWITPKINVERELTENHNIAVAIVVAAMIIGVSIVIAAVVSA